jgi:hypothetical protein
MRNENGKFEPEKTLINGAWYNLKSDFKNKDFFNDLMIKLAKTVPNSFKADIPKIPVSCIIDYCGFRILCESDIYVECGGSVCSRRVDNVLNQHREEMPNYTDIVSVLYINLDFNT